MLAMDVIEWFSTKTSSVLMCKKNLAKEMTAFASICKMSGVVVIALMATKTFEVCTNILKKIKQTHLTKLLYAQETLEIINQLLFFIF